MGNYEFLEESDRLMLLQDGVIPVGEISWVIKKQVMVLYHTLVSPDYQGQGLARKLVDRAVEIALDNELKVRPLCPYANKVFQETEEWHHLLEEE